VDYQIVWTEPASADLEAIFDYIAVDNLSAAHLMRVEILEHVDLLARMPLIGPKYHRDRAGRTREIQCRSYRIFYRVDESAHRVEILTVWHGARREPKL
jgi:toxin ParE1/3/4